MKTLIISMLLYKFVYTSNVVKKEKPIVKPVETVEIQKGKKETVEDKIEVPLVYENMTMEELSNKLEKNLSSTLDGKGKLFAEYSIELGLDPYLSVAIVLHETGCKWNCSSLVKYCNNVGGIKGNGNCSGYQYYPSLDDGIKSYLELLYNKYYSKGLTTPNSINPYYASSTSWSKQVNNYINQIKNS